MTELTDVSGAFGYGDILVGERVRLRGVREDDVPTLAKWKMEPGRMTTGPEPGLMSEVVNAGWSRN